MSILQYAPDGTIEVADDNFGMFKGARLRQGDLTTLASPLAKRGPQKPPKRPTTLHARIQTPDQPSRSFSADLDEEAGLDEDSHEHYRNMKTNAVRLTATDKDEDGVSGKGKHVGRITGVSHNARAGRVRLSVKLHDEDAWNDVASGKYSHVAVKTKPVSGGGAKPTRITLVKPPGHANKALHITQADGSVKKVDIAPVYTNAIAPVNKRDGSLDAIKADLRNGKFGPL